jgi:Ni,Fe-hydrogenase maturation factor
VDRLDQLPGGAPAKLTAQRADIVVFACGSPAHAEHDSIAIAACKGLPADVLERIDLKITGAMRPEYLRDLSAGTFVVIADTVTGTPGEIVEISFAELVGREIPLLVSSTPDQPLDEVVAMAELLRDDPVVGRFVGIGVADVDLRSEPDRDAVEALRPAILTAIERGASD